MHDLVSVVLVVLAESHLTILRSASAFSRMASATSAGSGRRSGVGTRSRWQFARPFLTPVIIGPSATGGFLWSRRNLFMAES